MSPKHRTPAGPLAGFKQVSKRPPRFECVFCTGDENMNPNANANVNGIQYVNTTGQAQGFVMDRNAMVLHSKMAEHKRKEKDLEEVEWANWNVGVREWGVKDDGSGDVGQTQPKEEWGAGWYAAGEGEGECDEGDGDNLKGGEPVEADWHIDSEVQKWEPTEEESERWQFADEKAERIRMWIECVNRCREELEEERRRAREDKEKRKDKAPNWKGARGRRGR
ncbi:hypothetical protein CPB83DRAFT_894994 [Crepidotus variabilis]|uniref:Uncharacterized protein n=1 Tax=Crepidotus variabilis TaxID=179855 RepID=A0A9P6EFI7_9AGAR|nr:hypothetical protein CPB83DRAFT_894994 [Crepidotus variabilis]